MSMQWQQLLVGLIVAAAALFSLWRLPGAATRLRYVAVMKRVARGRGPLASLARRLEARERRNDSACSGCSAAGSHPPPSREP